MMMVGAGVVVVIVVMLVVFAGGGTPTAQPAAAGTNQPARAQLSPAPAAAQSDDTPAPSGLAGFGEGEGKPGKPPKTAAPEIELAQVAKADTAFATAKQKKNDAELARRAGDHTAFKEHLAAASIAMQQSRTAIEPYTDWLEEADLEGWALPASYVDLQKRLGLYDKLFQQIKKVNPNH